MKTKTLSRMACIFSLTLIATGCSSEVVSKELETGKVEASTPKEDESIREGVSKEVGYADHNTLSEDLDDRYNSNELSPKKSETNTKKEEVKSTTQTKIDYKTPSSMQVLVNKENGLPNQYEPSDLVVPNVSFGFEGVVEKSYMRKEASNALEQLFKLANKEGIYLNAISGYRSESRQTKLYKSNVRKDGKTHTDQFSAKPGFSEHQTGLVMDVSSKSFDNQLEQSFEHTKEGKWLANNAHKTGFIIRYPKGKEDITGYEYEPWHIRYVGNIAEDIYNRGITLEEYISIGG
ncbi:peptidase M15 [Bacillus toyonensis]|uniref:M15 family metallopeptidase n=1 Tax=Bacillus toyonensis TaxID=155322 RepID=UPI000BFC34FE|nr:peptidase M15 [Bacillus toyonensis]